MSFVQPQQIDGPLDSCLARDIAAHGLARTDAPLLPAAGGGFPHPGFRMRCSDAAQMLKGYIPRCSRSLIRSIVLQQVIHNQRER